MTLRWRNCLKIGLTVLVLFLIIYFRHAFFGLTTLLVKSAVPLMLGFTIAYVVNILMNFYERYYIIICRQSAIQSWRRPCCLFLAFLSVSLVLVVLWQMIFPELAACIRTLMVSLPGTLEELTRWLQGNSPWCCNFLEKHGLMQDGVVDWDGVMQTVSVTVFHSVGDGMESVVNVFTTLITTVLTILLSVIFAVYLLARKERLKEDSGKLLVRCFGEKRMAHIWYVFDVFNQAFHSFIVGQCVEAVILGVLCMLGMLIFRFPYATMIGCLVGVTALIPLAGAYIGAAVGGLMIFTVSPLKALFFLIFLGILQQIEGNLIYPRVVGHSMGLPGVWVLAAVIVGGGAAGIVGMLFAVPVTAAAYRLFKDWLDGPEEG